MASPADRKRLKEKAAVEKARKALLALPKESVDHLNKLIDETKATESVVIKSVATGPVSVIHPVPDRRQDREAVVIKGKIDPETLAKIVAAQDGPMTVMDIPNATAGHPGPFPGQHKKRPPVIKPRLPHGAKFEATYNAEKEEWTGTLTTIGETFRAKRKGVFRLMECLDNYYQQFLTYKESQKKPEEVVNKDKSA